MADVHSLKIKEFEDSGLLEIIDGDRGKNYPRKDEFFKNGYCVFLNTSNIVDDNLYLEKLDFITKEKDSALRKGKLQRGDVIMTTRGTIGSVAYFNEKIPFENMRINSGMIIVRANNKKMNANYLYQVLKSPLLKNRYKLFSSGAAQPQLPIQDFRMIDLPLFEISTQEKIAKILSNYDDLIENNNKQIKILEELAQKIYKEWFVDFKFPGRETTTFKDSELGKIPQDWGICDIGNICSELTRGVTPKYKKGSKRYIINQKVNRGFSLDLQHLKELDDSLTVPENKYAHQKDILLNSLGEGTIGRVHYYYGENKLYPIDQHMTILRPGQYIGAYLYFYLASFEGQNRLNGLKTGGTNMTMLNISLLRNFEVVVPGLEILKKFDNITHRIFSLKVVLENKNKIIKQTRDMLLPKLISGEIDVENLEIV